MRVLDRDKVQKFNPLNDPLNDLEELGLEEANEFDIGDTNGGTALVQQLKSHASRGERKNKRKQSAREVAWVEALVNKYGDDYEKMVWDNELNPMQQTLGDIRRRIKRWKDSHT